MNTKHLLDGLPSNKVNWIRVEDFENLCFRLAQEHFKFDQPIPAFVTRSPGILESCLKTPLQRFDRKDLYPQFIDKISIRTANQGLALTKEVSKREETVESNFPFSIFANCGK